MGRLVQLGFARQKPRRKEDAQGAQSAANSGRPVCRHVSWNIVADSGLESRPLGRNGTYVSSRHSGSLGVGKPPELFKRTES
jgi:hypothetical protein